MSAKMKIPAPVVSKMSCEQFVGVLGGVFEHSPWVAEAAWECRPFRSKEEVHRAMIEAVERSSDDAILALLRAHPDLGTRISIGEYSTSEQQGAGLDKLSPEEYERFDALNEQYVGKFGFPFILAVRGKTKADILVSMTVRLGNDVQAEKTQALEEIKKITGFRLADLLEP